MRVGKLYYVTWIDAMDHSSGDPRECKVVIRQNVWRFLGTGVKEYRDKQHRYYKFAYGLDQIDQSNAGWMGLPVCMFVEAEEIQRPESELTKKEIEVDD